MADISTLLQERYGSTNDVAGSANPTLATLLQHKSVRQFLPEPVKPETLELILAAAQSAPTSSNLQAWSVVAVQDPERKSKAATLSGDQDFIRQAPVFLVFCADLNRLTKISQQKQKPGEALEFTEMFLIASLDAAFAAQNALTSAESLGLGGCYVGAARNRPQELAELLHLPPRVVGLFGLAIGKPNPAQPASVKPRLPQPEVLHWETWSEDGQVKNIVAYDETLADFNTRQQRGDAPKWTERSADRVATVESLHGRDILRDILIERGFNLR